MRFLYLLLFPSLVFATGSEEETSWIWDKVLGFFNWFRDQYNVIIDWFKGLYTVIVQWVKYFWDLIWWYPQKLWNDILQALVALWESIPTPDFITDLASITSQIPCEVFAWLGWARIPEGLSIIIGALILRRLIRMIPFIGG